MRAWLFTLILILVGANAGAQDTPRLRDTLHSVRPTYWTYDIGVAAGSDQIGNYNEIQVGANWYQNSWLLWRNALFTRFGSDYDSIFGLDTSIRGELNFAQRNSGFGLQLFAGPGARFATREHSAGFVEGGVIFKVARIYLGAGVRQMYFIQDREDRFGRILARDETQTSLLISSGF